MNLRNIIISRTDSIGDVVLTLPVAGVLKELFGDCKIFFIAKSYTKPVVDSCEHIDRFLDWDKLKELDPKAQTEKIKSVEADAILHIFPSKEIARLAKKARIPYRIGTTGRLYHYLTCNKLIPLSRRRSDLHEAQLNLKLIEPIGAKKTYSLEKIPDYYGFSQTEPLNREFNQLISKDKFNLILHPKSKGSAREWGLKNFARLIEILPKEKFKIFISGTKEEGELIKEDLPDIFTHVVDLTGKFTLMEFISFIDEVDGIVAASTGPLHIAAALGKQTIGIYPPIKPMHPGRWAPVGENSQYLVLDKKCSKCRKSDRCECIESIEPETVKNMLMNLNRKLQ